MRLTPHEDFIPLMENQFKFPSWSKIQRENIFMDLSRTLRFLRSHIKKDFLKREMDYKSHSKVQFHPSYFKLTLRLGGGKRMEWNGKIYIYIYIYIYFKNILSFPLFGSLSRRKWKGMERPFPCLGV